VGVFTEISFFTLAPANLGTGTHKDAVKCGYLPARVQLAKSLLAPNGT